MNKFTTTLGLAVIGLAFANSPVSAQGWFEKTTGVRTPKIIEDIAPDGISLGRAPRAPRMGSHFSGGESYSTVQVVTPPSMDSSGAIYSGSGSGGSRGSHVAWGELKYDSTGKAYFVSNYQNNYGKVSPSSVRVPQRDRRPAPQIVNQNFQLEMYNQTNGPIRIYQRNSQNTNYLVGTIQPGGSSLVLNFQAYRGNSYHAYDAAAQEHAMINLNTGSNYPGGVTDYGNYQRLVIQ